MMVSIHLPYLGGPSSEYWFREQAFSVYAVHLLLYCSVKYMSGIEVLNVLFFSVKEELLYNACGNQDYDEVLKRCEESVQELQVWHIVANTVIQQANHALYCTCMCFVDIQNACLSSCIERFWSQIQEYLYALLWQCSLLRFQAFYNNMIGLTARAIVCFRGIFWVNCYDTLNIINRKTST
jgi:hypothetical protein